MRLSRSPELMPVTIVWSTCWGVAVDMLGRAFRDTVMCYERPKIQIAPRSDKVDDTDMSREKRKYELKKRADGMAETHLRITEAAIELHGTVGPSRTTLSAVAKRAGVERRTL